MRKITSTILVALLTFSIGFGTVAAKPKTGKPENGNNGAITYPFKIGGDNSQVGAWNCSGVYVNNKNHTRINAECTVDDVEGYAGVYTNETHDVPSWVSNNSDLSNGVPSELQTIVGTTSQDETSWRVVVTPSEEGTSGTVNVVVVLPND